jgi:hypothetical protein
VKIECPDPFDPRLWDFSPQSRRIYLDDKEDKFVWVDEQDYFWAITWRWHLNRPHANRNGKKQYAVRSQGRGGNYMPKLYLHVEIMRRTGIIPPTPNFTIVDHRDGNEFNCRRSNLRWATPKMNRENLFGAYPTDLLDGMF